MKLDTWSNEQRIKNVQHFFSHITPNYDFMNHLMSARQDIRWRKFTSAKLPENAEKLLDIATGTGDLAFQMSLDHPESEIYGIDFVPEMIEKAKQKNDTFKYKRNMHFQVADALSLPYDDNSFDACTIAFGFRNIPDKQKALSEMQRVVKNGGTVNILEMTLPKNSKMRFFYKWYLQKVIPTLGRIFSPDPTAYNYLSESIKDFLQPAELEKLYTDAGFDSPAAYPLSFGITYLHTGVVSK